MSAMSSPETWFQDNRANWDDRAALHEASGYGIDELIADPQRLSPEVAHRLDKTNIIHCPIGKVSFGAEKLKENLDALMAAIVKAKPASTKGQYIKSCVIATTMGPGIKLNVAKFGA